MDWPLRGALRKIANPQEAPSFALVIGVHWQDKHPEGSYFLEFNNTWIPVRGDALEARFV